MPKVSFRFNHPIGRESQHSAWKRVEEGIRQQIKGMNDKPPPQQLRTNQLDLMAFTEFAGPEDFWQRSNQRKWTRHWKAAQSSLPASCRVVLTVHAIKVMGSSNCWTGIAMASTFAARVVDAAEVLKPFADPAGKVGPADLPRQLYPRPTPQPAAFRPWLSVPVLSIPVAPQAMLEKAKGLERPEWFTSMDRNGDGEVSLREFLGPIELFHKLDNNGDGLVSPDEARGANLDKKGD